MNPIVEAFALAMFDNSAALDQDNGSTLPERVRATLSWRATMATLYERMI